MKLKWVSIITRSCRGAPRMTHIDWRSTAGRHVFDVTDASSQEPLQIGRGNFKHWGR